ncbi:diguanylate cyclase [Psychrobacter sp. 1Y11]|uniref:diguanylate cyclase n=1 Tax=Psychrobacter sp. 1Y11 TaxID=3457446 RepID=UPI003FD00F50
MAISIYQLGYKKLSQIIFEWQVADRTSLLALFIFIEVALHWLWFLVVWFCRDTVEPYVDMQLFYPLWLGVTVTGVLLWWMIGYLARIKSNYKRLLRWQLILVLLYTVYITSIIVMVGYSSLVAGVSLIGGAILGMMLIKRRYVWRIFLLQIFLVLLAIISPYFGISLPNLRQMPVISPLIDIYSYLTYNEIMTIENAIAAFIFTKETLGWDDISELQRSSTFFWRATHVYLALPKALFTVYIFRKLLYILDESRKEILEHAHKDELTTLDNRRYGLTQMQQSLAEATNTQDYSVILLDLDLFKEVNDSYGHQVGDQVLREVAEVLIASLAATDAIISRYGGEEFLIFLPNTAHAETLSIAEQLRESIAEHIIQTEEKASVKVTASLGVYTLTADELAVIKEEHVLKQKAVLSSQAKQTRPRLPAFSQNNVSGSANALSDIQQQLPKDICQYLISSADKALYEAKDRGRNEVVSANDLLVVEI